MTDSAVPPILITIPDSYDSIIQRNYLREFAATRFPTVELIRLNREETIVDDLYMESVAKRFMEPVAVKVLPDHQPTKKTLTKYGMDQSRTVLFQIPTVHLSDIGYLYNNDTWMIGDLIRWGGDLYEIHDQVKAQDGYWAQTNIPFYYILGADFYRYGV